MHGLEGRGEFRIPHNPPLDFVTDSKKTIAIIIPFILDPAPELLFVRYVGTFLLSLVDDG